MAATQTTLDRLLDPLLTQDVARRVVDYRLDPQMQARLDDLRAKANEGELTHDERTEYEAFVEAYDLLAALKLQARRTLARHPTSVR